ncbi:MAG: protein jag [Anaerorhabdus sp.]
MTSYTAKTLEDLLQQASKDKGIDIQLLNYHILEEKKGLLGIGSSITAEVYSNDDIKEFLFTYLGNFFTNINQDIEIEISSQDKGFKILLNGENNAILIGKGGQTLQSITAVTRSAVSAHFKSRINVLIDINNYKVDRYAKVKSIAKRVAISVQKSKISASLDPMPNDERKVIHQYLEEFDNIKTESEGEGSRRHLKIIYVPNKSK